MSTVAIISLHSGLSILSFGVFVLLFVGHQYLEVQSIFTMLLNSIYSVMATPFIWLQKQFLSRSMASTHNSRANRSQQLTVLRISAVAIPIVGAVIFLSLYASANPVFSQAFNWLSFDSLPFTLFLAFLLAGFFFYHPLKRLNSWHDQQGFQILRQRKPLSHAHPLSLKFEIRTAFILLLLLNLLLFFFNASDLHYLMSGHIPVEGFSHADFVHQGIYTLIVSIVLAISIILYYFRGNINFFQANTTLKKLAYIWIAQNLLLAISSAYKNALYIEEFSLTYKRIGVFVYLLMAIIGLITTYQKLQQKRTLWYLLHINSWCLIVILLINSYVPWDPIITSYNLNKSNEPDYGYLISLSDSNIPTLLPYLNDGLLNDRERSAFEDKIKSFQKEKKSQSWLSWNYQDHLTLQALPKESK